MRLLHLLLALALSGTAAWAQSPAPPAGDWSGRVAGLERLDGFVPLYWDAARGRLLMEVARWDTELLYQVSLPAGVGSNPIGLDRGQLGPTHVVVFERVGPKVLLVERNHRYRAITADAAERRAVADSFARSVLWGFTAEAADGQRVLVDATAFFLRDAHGVAAQLRETRQGRYRVDDGRSAIYLPRTRGFQRNTEVEATVTLVTDEAPGALVRQVVPTAEALTVRQHHSFVELPPLDDAAFTPRRHDPRVGCITLDFHDYASPITGPVEQHWIVRHRLQKRDPGAAVSEAIAPIVYYVDNGAPEPIRSALVEGAAWWREAFEAAGFRNAFRVEVLPADADPMDLRYNIITWVHRSTRGWSYGGSVVDPRTGEILKGNVSLGSLRVRQDYLLGTGLVPVARLDGGDGAAGRAAWACDLGAAPDLDTLQTLDPTTDAVAMALARIRQLSAHEVGHTIGLEHNFAASTYGRASVMDYPAPLVRLREGRIDLSEAYGTGVGAYDRFAITYGYAQFPPGTDDDAALDRIVEDGLAAGMLFVADEHARPAGAAHPLANLWDNGPDPVDGLRQSLAVRRAALDRFGLANLPPGAPLSSLSVTLVPLYLHHRFQVQAAAKVIGGVYFQYSVKTPAGPRPAPAMTYPTPAAQRDALAVLLGTLDPAELALRPDLLALLPPRAAGTGGVNTERFPGSTAPIFDPVAAATTAADLTVSALLQPERAARALAAEARDPANTGLVDVLDALMAATWGTPAPTAAERAAIAAAVQSLVVQRVMDLAANPGASPAVRAEASGALRTLRTRLGAGRVGLGTPRAHRDATAEDITRFLQRPDAPQQRTPVPAPPPGEPIG